MTGAYDHAAAEFLSKILDIAQGCRVPSSDLKEMAAVESLSDCDPVICHVSDGAWNHLLSKKTVGLIIRVSTKGYRNPDRHPLLDSVGRVLLHLVPEPRLVTASDWGLILSVLRNEETRRAFVQSGLPRAIRPFFIYEAPRGVATLAALCQAYLASCGATGLEIEDTSYIAALDAMGWGQALRELNGPEVTAAAADRFHAVNQPAWWYTFLVDQRAPGEVWDEIIHEWDGREKWDILNEFLAIIGITPVVSPKQTHSSITPEGVALVYLTLSAVLRGGKK